MNKCFVPTFSSVIFSLNCHFFKMSFSACTWLWPKCYFILLNISFLLSHFILFELLYFVATVILISSNVSIFLDWFYTVWPTVTFCLNCHFIFFELSVYFSIWFYIDWTTIIFCLNYHFKFFELSVYLLYWSYIVWTIILYSLNCRKMFFSLSFYNVQTIITFFNLSFCWNLFYLVELSFSFLLFFIRTVIFQPIHSNCHSIFFKMSYFVWHFILKWIFLSCHFILFVLSILFQLLFYFFKLSFYLG